jgi:hypothetical protein
MIVAVGIVVDCVPSETIAAPKRGRLTLASVACGKSEIAFGDYSPLRYGWVLADVHKLIVPVPCKGALGIWKPSPYTRMRVLRSKLVPVD